MVKYIATSDFTSLTGKHFKKGDSVPNGDATSCMKFLKTIDENYSEEPVKVVNEDFKPEANKVMTKEDLNVKCQQSDDKRRFKR